MVEDRKKEDAAGGPGSPAKTVEPAKPKMIPHPISTQLTATIEQRSRRQNLVPEKFHSDIGSLKVKQMNFPKNESFFFPEKTVPKDVTRTLYSNPVTDSSHSG